MRERERVRERVSEKEYEREREREREYERERLVRMFSHLLESLDELPVVSRLEFDGLGRRKDSLQHFLTLLPLHISLEILRTYISRELVIT